MNEAQDSTGKKPRNIFRAEALDQLSSPEQLEQLLQVTNRKSWITLATLGFLIFMVLLWSIFGRIPVTVNGTGILIYPRQVMPFQASVQGQLSSMNIAVGDRVQAGQVIATVSVPDIAQRLDQERMRLERMEVRHATLVELQQKRLGLETEALQHKRDVLKDRISSAKAMANALRAKNQTYIAKQSTVINDYLATQTELEQNLEKRYQSFERLLDSQLASEEMVLQAYQKLVDVRIKKSDLELEAQQLELKRLETEEAYGEQQQRIAELVNQKQILGISGMRDLTDENTRIEITLKRDARPQVIVNQLFKMTAMETSFSVNMLAIHERRPKLLSLKEALDCYIEHRREVVIRRTRFLLEKAEDRAENLEALLLALGRLDEHLANRQPLEGVGAARAAEVAAPGAQRGARGRGHADPGAADRLARAVTAPPACPAGRRRSRSRAPAP